MGERHQLRPRPDQPLEGVHSQRAVVVDRRHLEHDPGARAQELPRHDVGVVFERGQNHLVARAEEFLTVACGHQVDGLRGALGEDDLLRRPGVEETPHPLAGALVGRRRLRTQRVNAAVDVGVFGLVAARDGVDHRLRLLGACAAVQEGQGLAVDRARKDREVRARARRIERGRGGRPGAAGGGVHASPPSAIQPPIRAASAARSGARSTASRSSAMKPSTINACAVRASRPRERR